MTYTLTEYGDFRGQSQRSVWERLRDATRGLALQCPFGQVPVDTADEGTLVHGYELLGIEYDIDDSPERLRQRAYDWSRAYAQKQLRQWDEDEAAIAEMPVLHARRRA